MTLPLLYFFELLFLPPILGLLCVYGVVLAQVGKLHMNCKILLFLWLLSFFMMVGSHFAFVVWRLAVGVPLPPARLEPSGNLYFMCAHEFGYALSSCAELLIVIERIGASVRLGKYQTAPCAVGAGIAASLAGSALFTFFFHIGPVRRADICLIFCNCFDIAVIILNRCIHVYCLRRRLSNSSTKLLNDKYQLNEIFELTRAILPVSIMSTVLKVIAYSPSYSYVFFKVSYYTANTACYIIHSLNCALCTALLLTRYRVTREKLRALCQPRRLAHALRPAEAALSTEQLANSYFTQLSASWRK